MCHKINAFEKLRPAGQFANPSNSIHKRLPPLSYSTSQMPDVPSFLPTHPLTQLPFTQRFLCARFCTVQWTSSPIIHTIQSCTAGSIHPIFQMRKRCSAKLNNLPQVIQLVGRGSWIQTWSSDSSTNMSFFNNLIL